MKQFKIQSNLFTDNRPIYFSEYDAPIWLCEGGVKGSTMDNRWFWNDHVLTLDANESVDTDFSTITRI